MGILNLNYKPEVLVSTENMDETTRKTWRKKGIGGSDAAAVLNLSPFRTKRDLYYDKTDTNCVFSDEDDNWVAKQVGHCLEDLVAQIFAKKTGYRVWQEKKMFYHPLYKCMIADVDYMFETPEGLIGILECKTGHYLAQDKWAGNVVPIHYEYQTRHYMAVLNVNVVYIACLFGNNEADFVYRRIERDLDIEEMLINAECDFWNNSVLAKVPPVYTESADLALESIRKFCGNADTTLPKIGFNPNCEKLLKEYLELKEMKAKIDKTSKELKERMDAISVPFVDKLGQYCKAECETKDAKYEITYNPRYTTGIKKDKLELFKNEHPDLYDKYVTTTESRTFGIRLLKAS